jgi:hypothetical protein
MFLWICSPYRANWFSSTECLQWFSHSLKWQIAERLLILLGFIPLQDFGQVCNITLGIRTPAFLSYKRLRFAPVFLSFCTFRNCRLKQKLLFPMKPNSFCCLTESFSFNLEVVFALLFCTIWIFPHKNITFLCFCDFTLVSVPYDSEQDYHKIQVNVPYYMKHYTLSIILCLGLMSPSSVSTFAGLF